MDPNVPREIFSYAVGLGSPVAGCEVLIDVVSTVRRFRFKQINPFLSGFSYLRIEVCADVLPLGPRQRNELIQGPEGPQGTDTRRLKWLMDPNAPELILYRLHSRKHCFRRFPVRVLRN